MTKDRKRDGPRAFEWTVATGLLFAGLAYAFKNLSKIRAVQNAAQELDLEAPPVASRAPQEEVPSNAPSSLRTLFKHLCKELVGLAALGVALITLWLTLVKPFELSVTRGFIHFVPSNPGGKSPSFFIRVPLVFKNMGARPGRVLDVMLTATSGTEGPVTFTPTRVVDSEKWAQVGLKKSTAYEAISKDLALPSLGPYEQIPTSWAFMATDHSKLFPWMTNNLVALEMYVLCDGKRTYERAFSLTMRHTFRLPFELWSGDEIAEMNDPFIDKKAGGVLENISSAISIVLGLPTGGERQLSGRFLLPHLFWGRQCLCTLRT